ncbi:MAG: hypothetical protein HY752_02950, partial [Nitrospirae bacterium]|nr:hypothetical protein [Nitrospirota bacterium]
MKGYKIISSFVKKLKSHLIKESIWIPAQRTAGMTDFFTYFVIPVKTGIQKDCYSWFEEFPSTKIRKREIIRNDDFCAKHLEDKSLRFLPRKSGVRGLPFLAVLLFVSFVLSPSRAYSAVLGDYCSTPPYVAGIKSVPNIMIVYDDEDPLIFNRAYSTTYMGMGMGTTYYGFFNSTNNYKFMNGTGTRDNAGWFEKSTCTTGMMSDRNCFSGNLLNWALMSNIDITRKALVGFGRAGRGYDEDDWNGGHWWGAGDAAGLAFTYTGDLMSHGNSNSWTVSGEFYTFCLEVDNSGDHYVDSTKLKVRYNSGGSCSGGSSVITSGSPNYGRVRLKQKAGEPISERLGLVQQYTDKDRDYKYDLDAPRLGIRTWRQGRNESECGGGRNLFGSDYQVDIMNDTPALTTAQREEYFRAIITAINTGTRYGEREHYKQQKSYLGSMMKEIIRYFQGLGQAGGWDEYWEGGGGGGGEDRRDTIGYEDDFDFTQTPYSWANDPQKACRKTYTLFVSSGEFPNDPYAPLTTTCSSGMNSTDFSQNTCYGYTYDLYTTDAAKQNISTYFVHTTSYNATGAANSTKLNYATDVSSGRYYNVSDMANLYTNLNSAMSNILSVANISSSVLLSGSSPSMIASTQGSGASLIQAYSYPLSP